MESQGTKSKKNRRKRKHRGARGRNSRPSGGTPAINELHSRFPSNFAIPPQSNWFWQNYRQVMDWQGRHQVAYWKSRSLALECQNSLLMEFIEKNDVEEDYEDEEYFPAAAPIEETNEEDEEDEEDIGGESIVFEVNEDMLAFFQQTMKHKQEMKELRDAEKTRIDALKHENESFIFPKANHGLIEGTILYGKNAPTILAMETSIQLNFDRFVEKEKPQLWPNIPLNL